MKTNYAQFAAGQKVKTIYGALRTVLWQRGCQVWVVEECGGWYHPDNLFAV